jgi:hypothetical protein
MLIATTCPFVSLETVAVAWAWTQPAGSVAGGATHVTAVPVNGLVNVPVGAAMVTLGALV